MKSLIVILLMIPHFSASEAKEPIGSMDLKNQNVQGESSANPVVNTSNFAEILKSKQFVDKSLFLRRFIVEGADLYISGPSHLGKSTLLDMMRTFLTAQFHRNGTHIEPITTAQHIFFSAPRRFDGTRTALKIYEHKSFFEKHFQQYCVLSVNFYLLKSVHDISSFEEKIFEIIRTVFKTSCWQGIPNGTHCKQLKSLVYVYETKKLSSSEFDLKRTAHIKQFLEGLWSCFGKKILVLIDEYDSLLQGAMTSNASNTDAGLMLWEVRKTMEALTQHHAVYRTLCVGVMNLGGVVASLALHIPHVQFFADDEIPRYFGFSAAEVSALLENFSMASDVDPIIAFYSGYRVLNPQIGRVFNPGSILSCIKNEGVTEGYFKVFGWHTVFDALFSEPVFGEKILLSVMENTEIDIGFEKTGVGIDRILDLTRQIRKDSGFAVSSRLSNSGMDYVFQYFLELGYFSVARGMELMRKVNATDMTPRSVRVKIVPTNLEMKHILYRTLFASQFPLYSYGITPEKIADLGAALNNLSDKNETLYEAVIRSVREFSFNKSEELTHLRFPLYYCINKLFSSGGLKIVDYDGTIEETGKAFGLAFVNLDNEGVMIQLERNVSSIDALGRMIRDKYYSVFDSGKFARFGIRSRMLLGLRCTCTNQCDLCYTLNSGRISNAKCLTCPKNESLEKYLYQRKTE